jgi:hypothetical protein
VTISLLSAVDDLQISDPDGMTEVVLSAAVQAALARVRDLRTALEQLRAHERALAAERDAAIAVLVEAGLSYEAVARESGVSRGRVGQIVHGRRH